MTGLRQPGGPPASSTDVTVGPKPHQEAALGPGPSLGRLDAGAQQRPAGAKVVHPSGPLAKVRREFSVSRRVASPRQYRTHSVARQWRFRRHTQERRFSGVALHPPPCRRSSGKRPAPQPGHGGELPAGATQPAGSEVERDPPHPRLGRVVVPEPRPAGRRSRERLLHRILGILEDNWPGRTPRRRRRRAWSESTRPGRSTGSTLVGLRRRSVPVAHSRPTVRAATACSWRRSRGVNVAEALRVYERLRVLLREELGIAPSPTVQAVHRRLLQNADS
jgi:Bacterial transcriptional activator domain